MTKAEARARISEMDNEYGYSDTWPLAYQQEFERLCDIIHGATRRAPNAFLAAIDEALSQFEEDPADTDFQRGYQQALTDLKYRVMTTN